jgi:hypothetical protein
MQHEGPVWFQASLLPARAAYLIRAGSRNGFRRAVQEASTRWGGMTEPIISVRSGGRIDGWWKKVVELSAVQALVNVDADDGDAEAAGSLLGLEVVPLRYIDRSGPARWSTHPTSLPNNMQEDWGPIIACAGSPLWQATAAGDLSATHEAALREAHVPFDRPRTSDQVARAAVLRSTLIDRTTAAFSENLASGAIGTTPAIFHIVSRNGLRDCQGFWNLRALRPLMEPIVAPMFLIPEDEIEHWIGFDTLLSRALERPDEFTPDVLLASIGVPDARLHELAALLGLRPSTQKARVGMRSPAEMRTGPFTYLTTSSVDPRRWFVFKRRYGTTTDIEAHFVSGNARLQFPSPVSFQGGGSSLIHLRSQAFDKLPKRSSVARLIEGNASWHEESIQIAGWASSRYQLNVHIPTLDETLHAILVESTKKYGLSDKGRLGAALLENTSHAKLLEPGVYEAVIALTTPRSKELLRELRRMRDLGSGEQQLIEFAMQWGGRSERRVRSAPELRQAGGPGIVHAVETLCSMRWAERGMAIACEHCGLRSFVAMVDVCSTARCPGCESDESYAATKDTVTVYYRLNSHVDRSSDQGVLPHVLAVAAALREDPSALLRPGVDVQLLDGGEAEIDILGLFDGRLLAGEVKTNPAEFTDKQIARDIECSLGVRADVHLMATVGDIPPPALSFAKERASHAGLDLLVWSKSQLRPV